MSQTFRLHRHRLAIYDLATAMWLCRDNNISPKTESRSSKEYKFWKPSLEKESFHWRKSDGRLHYFLLSNSKSGLSPLVQESNSENCLDLIFVAFPCEKDIIVTSVIRKFILGVPRPGSFLNIDLSIWAQQVSEHMNLRFKLRISNIKIL